MKLLTVEPTETSPAHMLYTIPLLWGCLGGFNGIIYHSYQIRHGLYPFRNQHNPILQEKERKKGAMDLGTLMGNLGEGGE
jgi:hypothetical protein